MYERFRGQYLTLSCSVSLAADLCVLLHVVADVTVQLHFLEVSYQYYLLGGVVSRTPNPQPGGSGYPYIVWVITFDLFDIGGPTSRIRYRQHSSRDHMTTHAQPLRQSRDPSGGTGMMESLY
jgi:hypothetical protein